MARDGDKGTSVRGKNLVKHFLGPNVLIVVGLAVERLPELIIEGEARLDLVSWEAIMYIAPVAPPVASVSTNRLSEVFLNLGYERVRQVETIESVISCLEASSERASIVALGRRDFLVFNLRCPERVDCEGLSNPKWREMSVCPSHRSVAVQLRIVTIPSRRAIVCLCIIMIAITMTAHVEELVFGATRRLAVELVYLVFETLPLGQVLRGTVIGWICAVDEAKLHLILCKHLPSYQV